MADLHVGALLNDRGERGDDLRLDAADLTTHGICVGMTGSGKTGLGVVLLEECARAGIGALVIDPKGDLANLALRFPTLSAKEFSPWVDPADAEREGLTTAELAQQTAQRWEQGLASWGLAATDVAALRDAADVTVFTPGSTAGVPLSMLGSLTPPPVEWDSGEEMLRDEIAAFVDGLLTMAGVDADPLASREHALLSTIIETAWRQGTTLDQPQLVGQVLAPPVRKLGVFDVDTFFPPADRSKLAMRLNGLLASPSAASWLEGAPVDIGAMLRTPDGRPRCAVVSIAHLTDEERQFAVATLLSKVVTWMRGLPGTGTLRALVYMDEVAGFAPPSAVPPAKRPILTIMKQARAFGVGMVLATQNPVDLDYKAIGNAGTWLIGRLQTERDRARLIDGMSSAAGDIDLAALSETIGALDKREFVLHRASGGAPVRFTTRWAMSYLRGPLTSAELRALTPASPVAAPSVADAPASRSGAAADTTAVAPQVASAVRVTYLDPAATWSSEVGAATGGTTLEAALAVRVALTYRDAKADIDHTQEWEVVFHPLSARLDPDTAISVDYDDRDLRTDPPPDCLYSLPQAPVADVGWYRDVEKALLADVRADRALEVRRNAALKLYARIGESEQDFAARCAAAAAQRADAEAAKLAKSLEGRIARKRAQVEGAQRGEAAAAADAQSRRAQEVVSGAGALLGVLLGGGSRAARAARGAGGVASRRGMTQRAAQRREEAAARVALTAQELSELEQQLLDELDGIQTRWQETAADIDSVSLSATASNVRVTDRALVWVPTA